MYLKTQTESFRDRGKFQRVILDTPTCEFFLGNTGKSSNLTGRTHTGGGVSLDTTDSILRHGRM